jgi:CheY-like chemotaxis protein
MLVLKENLMSDELFFAEELPLDLEFQGTWKVLIVDDEPGIHAVTRLALNDVVFQDKGIEFLSAHSGQEAQKLILEHNDLAVILLDVVMETDDAGLKVVEFIRNQAQNQFTRIILRTGQPGQCPEREVIINYDINDYKNKTELTAQKLFTVIIAALRSYRDIMAIEENRQGLKKIIAASANLYSLGSMESFMEGILQQVASLLGGSKDMVYLTSNQDDPTAMAQSGFPQLNVLTGQGEYQHKQGERIENILSGRALESCQQAYSQKSMVYEDHYFVAYCDSKTNRGSLLFMSGLPRELNASDQELIEIIAKNIQFAVDNVVVDKES